MNPKVGGGGPPDGLAKQAGEHQPMPAWPGGGRRRPHHPPTAHPDRQTFCTPRLPGAGWYLTARHLPHTVATPWMTSWVQLFLSEPQRLHP